MVKPRFEWHDGLISLSLMAEEVACPKCRESRARRLEKARPQWYTIQTGAPAGFAIKAFLLGNRAEVKGMLLTEYNEEKVMEKEREEGRREGRMEERSSNIAALLKGGVALDVLYKAFGEADVDSVARNGG